MPVSFTYGSTTIEFPKGMTLPITKEAEKAQVEGETDGGQVFIYTKGKTTRFVTLTLPHLTQALWDSLYSFWDSTVNGKAIAFTFVDELGVTYTGARIWSPRLKVTEWGWSPSPWYTAELQLRIGG